MLYYITVLSLLKGGWMPENLKPSPVQMSSDTASKIKRLMDAEGRGFLRVLVHGGGCSGFRYGIKFEKEPGQSDNIFECQGLVVLIDPISIIYVRGSTIEFETFKGFSIINPNAKATCGCGQSFEPK
jgi:iron-sulfur cluster insertion protein